MFLTSLFLSNTATVNIFFGLKLDLKLQGNLMFQIEKMCSMQLENAKCTKMCQNNRLDCGHVCRLKCHVKKDPEHKSVSQYDFTIYFSCQMSVILRVNCKYGTFIISPCLSVSPSAVLLRLAELERKL